MGYHRAGFEVVGVDIEVQLSYPFFFAQMDALDALRDLIEGARWSDDNGFDAIHASPPCQAFTVYGNNRNHVKQDHPDLIEATRSLLKATSLPYVIENVPKAPLIDPVQICGTAFDGEYFDALEVRRHRLFEANWPIEGKACNHERLTERKYPGSSNRPNGRTVCNVGEWRVPLEMQQSAMGIDWMTVPELSQAIPPSYTHFIGNQLRYYLYLGEAHLEVS